MTDGNTRKKAQAVFFSLVMVLSMVGGTVAFAGGAAAAVTDITGDTANNVEIGQASTTQDVTFSTSIDGASSTESYTLNVDSANIDPASVSIAGNGDDISLGGTDSAEVSVGSVTDNTDTDGTIAIDITDSATGTAHSFTITATLTHDTSGISAETGANSDSYTLTDAGTSSNQGTVSFSLVDTTAPSAPTNPSATAVSNGNIDVSFDAATDDGTGVASYSVKRSTTQGSGYSEVGTVTDDGSGSYTFTDTSATDGTTYYYVVTASDGAENEGTQSTEVSATSDATAPTVNTFEITNADPTNTQDIGVSLTTNEQIGDISVSVSGAETGTLGFADFAENDNGDGTFTYDATYSASTDGDYTVTLDTAADAAGNDGSDGETDSVTVDTNSLSVSIDSPSDGDIIQSQETISGSANDDNEVTSVVLEISDGSETWDDSVSSFTSEETTVEVATSGGQWTYNNAPTTDGSYDAVATATDSAGNTASSASVSYTIDTTPPGVSNVQISDLSDQNGVVTAGDEVSISADVADLNNIDTVTADASAFAAGDVELTQSGGDTYTGTATVGSSVTDGEQSVTVNATDVAGNGGAQAVESTGTVTIDTTAPEVSNVQISESTENGILGENDDVSISAEVTDANGVSTVTADASAFGAGSVELTQSNGDTYTGTATVTTGATNGEQSVTVSATDVASNGGAQAVESNSLSVDVTAPEDLSIDSPTSQLNLTSGSEFDLKYSYSDTNPDSVTVELTDGTDTYTYNIDDSQYANENAQKTLTIDLSENAEEATDLADSTYDVTVTATDANTGSASTTTADVVVVDDTAPTFSSFDQEDTSSTETNFSVDITEDGSGVDESEININVSQDGVDDILDGSSEHVSLDGATLTVDTQNSSLDLNEGPVTVNYTVVDYSGNVGTSTDNTFTINTAPPAIESVEAEAGEDEVTVTFTEDVKANDSDISKDDFAYTDVSGGDATEILSVDAGADTYTDEVTLTLDADVGVADLSTDEVNVRDAALSDENDNNVKNTAAATVALEDTNAPAAPGLSVDNVTAENEGSYEVTVTGDTAATANITVKNSTSGDVFLEETNVNLDASSSTTETLDLSNIENGDVTIEATVNDRGVDRTSSSTIRTVPKDNVSATIESVQTDAGTDELEVTFSEDVKNVDGNLNAENLTIDSVTGDGATYTLTVGEDIAPSDIDNESVTVSATAQVTDIVGTQASTSAVTLQDGSDPGVTYADGSSGADTVEVYFNESVYNASDDGLTADDFTYVNQSGVDHTVDSVEHDAGERMATVTLDSALTADDLNSDVIEVTANDSVDKQTTTAALIQELVDIDDFDVSNTTETSAKEVQVSFTSDEELDTFSVNLDTEYDLAEFDADNEVVELNESDFDVTAQEDGTYDYTYNYTVPRDGQYEAELIDATAVGGSEEYSSPEDSAMVDYDDPEPVDAEIVEADGVSTTVAVQFNEPVDPVNGANLQNITIAGESADGVDYAGALNAWEFEFDGVVATGDGQNVAFDKETVDEVFGDSTSVAGTSEKVDTHEFHLSEGVNFVSVPAEFGSLDIANSEFSDMSVMTYENGEWVSYAPDKSADNQDLESMEGGQGYIVNADSDATVDVTVRNEEPGTTAEDATPGQQQLQEGWNLVGHWQEGSQDADDGAGNALDSISGDSSATNVYGQAIDGEFSYTPVNTFEPGEAYWVFVEDDEIYTASNYGAFRIIEE